MKSETVTGRDWISNDRCIDVLMGKLRKKIEEDPHNPSMIKNYSWCRVQVYRSCEIFVIVIPAVIDTIPALLC